MPTLGVEQHLAIELDAPAQRPQSAEHHEENARLARAVRTYQHERAVARLEVNREIERTDPPFEIEAEAIHGRRSSVRLDASGRKPKAAPAEAAAPRRSTSNKPKAMTTRTIEIACAARRSDSSAV